MKRRNVDRRRERVHPERGIVLILALMALLVIMAVATTLLFLTETESRLVSSQRLAARAYTGGLGGLEEARARLSGSDPSFLGPPATFPATNISKTIPFPTTVVQVLYILNPFPAGEFTIANVRNSASPYYDWEYDREWCPAGTLFPPGCGALAAATVVNPTPPPITPLTSDMVALRTAVPLLPEISYKWVRITILTERAAGRDIDGSGGPLNNTVPVFWDQSTNRMNVSTAANRPGRMVYRITAFALIPATGATRLVQLDVGQPIPISIDSALRAGGNAWAGSSLNIKGDSDPICPRPGNWGARAGGTFTPGGGAGANITGNGQAPNQWLNGNALPYNVPALINMFKPGAKKIDVAATNVKFGPPSCPVNVYCGPKAVLGVVPTTDQPLGGDISSITAPGTSETYYSPGNLTLGALAPAGAQINGQGLLLVDGDLTIDTSNGFNYYGLILVTGNIIVKSTAAIPKPMVIHGAVITGGTFDARLLGNSPGTGQVEIQMDACFVENQLDAFPRPILAYREVAVP